MQQKRETRYLVSGSHVELLAAQDEKMRSALQSLARVIPAAAGDATWHDSFGKASPWPWFEPGSQASLEGDHTAGVLVLVWLRWGAGIPVGRLRAKWAYLISRSAHYCSR